MPDPSVCHKCHGYRVGLEIILSASDSLTKRSACGSQLTCRPSRRQIVATLHVVLGAVGHFRRGNSPGARLDAVQEIAMVALPIRRIGPLLLLEFLRLQQGLRLRIDVAAATAAPNPTPLCRNRLREILLIRRNPPK
jgi:hypothetical protein